MSEELSRSCSAETTGHVIDVTTNDCIKHDSKRKKNKRGKERDRKRQIFSKTEREGREKGKTCKRKRQ